ncbi:MAG: pyridoxal phosphate-dependent aminotransferase [Candidatus Rifleibacteriota bacterium]
MTLFRQDLLRAGPPADISVPRKKHMLCLNESPLDPYQAIDEAFQESLRQVSLNRYFSPVTGELKKALVDYVGHGVTGKNLLWGNGADDMLFACFLAVKEDNQSFVLTHAPSYFDYSTYSRAAGLNIRFQNFNRDLSFNEKEYVDILNLPDCRLGVLCNPNNPTGHLLSDNQILYILSNTKKPVIIDETYFEFSGKTWIDRIGDFPHLIIVRSFSKSFSAAGVRFGYLVSTPENVEEIRKVQTIFNTSILVQTFVLTMLMNRQIFLGQVKETIALKQQLFAEMQKISGLKTWPTFTNFQTFTIGEKSSALFEHLKNSDIAIRDVGAHPILKNHLRVSIGSAEQNNCFLEAVKGFVGKNQP